MRRDLHVLRLGHPRDLLGLEETPDATEVHLKDGRSVGTQHAKEIVFGGEPLAGRDRDMGAACDEAHLLG